MLYCSLTESVKYIEASFTKSEENDSCHVAGSPAESGLPCPARAFMADSTFVLAHTWLLFIQTFMCRKLCHILFIQTFRSRKLCNTDNVNNVQREPMGHLADPESL